MTTNNYTAYYNYTKTNNELSHYYLYATGLGYVHNNRYCSNKKSKNEQNKI